jgi:HAD superfamily hydrolase (TIGR01484 family)
VHPIDQLPPEIKKTIQYVLTDIDDTLTFKGRLPAHVFGSMERLQKAGIKVVPITGRPAGWCDHIARMWPVDAVVGENGAFYFAYDEGRRKMIRRYFKDEKQRIEDRGKLKDLQKIILENVPGCALSADQVFREADLAIDFCEDVPPLPMEAVKQIKKYFEDAGAEAKISSIHVNGWFGNYDKLSMTRILFEERFSTELSQVQDSVVFCGDSPNDAPMFHYFQNSVGVANILDFTDRLDHPPTWVTKQPGGHGFTEMVELLFK